MTILGMFILTLVVISLVVAFRCTLELTFEITIKRLSNPYFYIGVSFNEYDTTDEDFIEQELVIGLFFINFIVISYKEKMA